MKTVTFNIKISGASSILLNVHSRVLVHTNIIRDGIASRIIRDDRRFFPRGVVTTVTYMIQEDLKRL